MFNEKGIKQLAKAIRKDVLDITFNSGVNGGHLGGAFSCADILAVLYGEVLNTSPSNVLDDNRDRFLLSKGHAALAHYATLYETGYITLDELKSFETSGTSFPTHEVMNVPKGIEISSGSLGYGLSIGVGIALSAKRLNKSYKIYVLLGDGECNEGTVWEAVMAANRYKLDNLVLIIDANKQQLDGYTSDVMPINSFETVLKGFGCNTISIDGNDVNQVYDALVNHFEKDKPLAIVANTLKAKGIKSIEGTIGWHHVRLDEEHYKALLKELEEQND